jgi:glucoamylase
MAESLDEWLERQYALSVQGLLRSVSSGLTKVRPGFGQSIVALPGSVIASPVLAAYDPEPDYFFHWFRDAALVMDALRLARHEVVGRANAAALFDEFVEFSLSVQSLNGATLALDHPLKSTTSDEYKKFLRPDSELRLVRADRVAADTRVNPDATLDISQWPRPQNDGPALRALALMRWLQDPAIRIERPIPAETLLQRDLEFVLQFAGKACYDIWEEDFGLHYYTLLVSSSALREGAKWLKGRGALNLAETCNSEANGLLRILNGFWLDAKEHYASRRLSSGAVSPKELDFAVILAVLHSQNYGGAHSLADPKVHATFSRLEELFEAEYPLNRTRSALQGTAMGRYAGDHYYSGGPYFFSTLGAAEFCYRAAAQGMPSEAKAFMLRGDEFLRTVRAHAPLDGKLAEQFDRHSGAPSSARDLAWSHAALITARAARRSTLRNG